MAEIEDIIDGVEVDQLLAGSATNFSLNGSNNNSIIMINLIATSPVNTGNHAASKDLLLLSPTKKKENKPPLGRVIVKSLFKQVRECIESSQFQVAERALTMFAN
jgi:hypothetical protein